jgi:hypothetical protein
MSGRHNDPGLSALRFRVGTHATFKAAMLAMLATRPALSQLTTRRDDDPSIALVDAWAAVLDVLSFYQERIANEGYVRTALERRSVLELARAIGYELNPGVAASVYLAFGVSELAGSPAAITIPAGARVQSVPTAGELPQTFEIGEPFEARAEWNTLRPRLAPMVPRFGATTLHLRGIANRVSKGDLVLMIGDEGSTNPAGGDYDLRRVKDVTTSAPPIGSSDPNAGLTSIVLDRFLGTLVPRNQPGPFGGSPEPEAPFGGNGPIDIPIVIGVPGPYRRTNARVYVFRQSASLFGSNAPDWLAMSADIQGAYDTEDVSPQDWPRFNVAYEDSAPESARAVHLDAIYSRLVVGEWVVLAAGVRSELFRAVAVSEQDKTDFTLSAKTTCVTLDRDALITRSVPAGGVLGTLVPVAFTLRGTRVFGQPEPLELAPDPAAVAITGRAITLDRVIGGLIAGQAIVVTGSDATTGEVVSEVATLASSSPGDTTELVLATPLVHSYVPATLTLHANVVLATQGQSTSEILGSGNASLAFQKFALKQKPLTFVAAPTPSGAESTLVVRVNRIAWTEVPSLHGRGPDERVFVTRIDDDGSVLVQFGDGVTGARVPSGAENVTASYRVGLGAEGLVDAGQISLLMTRPLGLDGVVNPLASSGAADPESIDRARAHAPLTVRTLGRIVSLVDFESFAGAFAGIGKAQATLVWNGQRDVVHLTLGGVGGAPVAASSSLLSNLRAAIDAARQTDRLVQIDSYTALRFQLEARVTIASNYLASDVLPRAALALSDAFAFDARELGGSVAKSQVLAILQDVEGVVAIDLDALHLVGAARSLETVLRARRATFAAGGIAPAELLLLATEAVVLLEA